MTRGECATGNFDSVDRYGPMSRRRHWAVPLRVLLVIFQLET